MLSIAKEPSYMKVTNTNKHDIRCFIRSFNNWKILFFSVHTERIFLSHFGNPNSGRNRQSED